MFSSSFGLQKLRANDFCNVLSKAIRSRFIFQEKVDVWPVQPLKERWCQTISMLQDATLGRHDIQWRWEHIAVKTSWSL